MADTTLSGALIATAVMVAASAGLNLTGPYLLGKAIDRYIIRHDIPGLGRIALCHHVVHGQDRHDWALLARGSSTP